MTCFYYGNGGHSAASYVVDYERASIIMLSLTQSAGPKDDPIGSAFMSLLMRRYAEYFLRATLRPDPLGEIKIDLSGVVKSVC